MHKKFVLGVFEQYLFAYGDSHMGICSHFVHEKFAYGAYAKMPENACFGPFISA
jgi:hypothetical protein